MFSMVMRNPAYCKDILERIPGRKIAEICFDDKVTVEEDISVAIYGRNIRLDVRFEGYDAWYNMEMQVLNEHNIPKRSRYHHSTIDVLDFQKQKEALRQEQDKNPDNRSSNRMITFNNLKESYVIFICCFDQYELGQSLY